VSAPHWHVSVFACRSVTALCLQHMCLDTSVAIALTQRNARGSAGEIEMVLATSEVVPTMLPFCVFILRIINPSSGPKTLTHDKI